MDKTWFWSTINSACVYLRWREMSIQKTTEKTLSVLLTVLLRSRDIQRQVLDSIHLHTHTRTVLRARLQKQSQAFPSGKSHKYTHARSSPRPAPWDRSMKGRTSEPRSELDKASLPRDKKKKTMLFFSLRDKCCVELKRTCCGTMRWKGGSLTQLHTWRRPDITGARQVSTQMATFVKLVETLPRGPLADLFTTTPTHANTHTLTGRVQLRRSKHTVSVPETDLTFLWCKIESSAYRRIKNCFWMCVFLLFAFISIA